MTRHPNPSRPRRSLHRALAIVALAGVPAMLTACGDDDDDESPAATEPMSTEMMGTEPMDSEMMSETTEMMSEATSG